MFFYSPHDDWDQAAIGIFLLAALYELLHVDIEAAVVLFQMNDSMEVSCFCSLLAFRIFMV